MNSVLKQASLAITPEVRKAWGVYYTPAHIVDYFVKNTVGKLLSPPVPSKGNGWGEGRAVQKGRLDGPLRICDPACGTGLFLLGAYQYLLDWYLGYYATNDPEAWARRKTPPIRRTPTPAWRLTLTERRRILTAHIYGVDIDPQAVAATKVALLQKLLDDQPGEATSQAHRLFHEKLLRDLASNVKCGNALIGPDIYDSPRTDPLDEAQRRRINAFDWHEAFPHVFGATVPMYRRTPSEPGRPRPRPNSKQLPRTSDRGGGPPGSLRHVEQIGFDVVIGNPPYVSYSGRQAVTLSPAERAYFSRRFESTGWPTSHGFFIERSVRDLSKRFVGFIVPAQVGHLAGYAPVRKVLDRHSRLAEVRDWGEAVFTGVVTPALTLIADRRHVDPTRTFSSTNRRITIARAPGGPWLRSKHVAFLDRLRENSISLGKLVADPGVHTGNCAKKLIFELDHAPAGCVPVLEGRQVSRYRCNPPTKLLRLHHHPSNGEYFTIRPRQKYARAAFVIRQTAAFPIVGPRQHADYFRNSLLALYAHEEMDARYLVGLLNSRLLRFVYGRLVQESAQKAFPQVKVRSLRALPIRPIKADDPPDQKRHNRMVALVQQMLDLHKALAPAKTNPQQTTIRRQINATDRKIDQLVYRLYDLTVEETRMVEKATAS